MRLLTLVCIATLLTGCGVKIGLRAGFDLDPAIEKTLETSKGE